MPEKVTKQFGRLQAHQHIGLAKTSNFYFKRNLAALQPEHDTVWGSCLHLTKTPGDCLTEHCHYQIGAQKISAPACIITEIQIAFPWW